MSKVDEEKSFRLTITQCIEQIHPQNILPHWK